MPDIYGNPLPGEIQSPEESLTPLPLTPQPANRGAQPRLGDLMRAPAEALRRSGLPKPLQSLLGAVVPGIPALEGLANTGDLLGKQAATVANPFGMALLNAFEGAANTDAGLAAMDKVAAGRGAKKPAAAPKPAAKEEPAVTGAGARRAVRAPLLPQTMFGDLNAGLAATAQFVAEQGAANREQRANIAAGQQQAAVARALAPKSEFETDPVTGAISGVAVFNPATGLGAKRPLRTVVSDQEKAAYMAEADAKYRAGADLDEINTSLKRVGLTYTPAK